MSRGVRRFRLGFVADPSWRTGFGFRRLLRRLPQAGDPLPAREGLSPQAPRWEGGPPVDRD